MKKYSPLMGIGLILLLSMGPKNHGENPSIVNPNNIYLYDTLLLVSDSVSGLLMYSVANEGAPKFKARIPLRGNRGMAMKDSIIYANSYGGIIAIRLVNDTDYEVTSVIKTDPYHPLGAYFNDYPMYSSSSGLGCASSTVAYSGGTESPNSTGVGGSYAVFAVIDSFLYYIDNQSIITMDISKPAAPRKLSETYVDWSIETLFPTKEYLFIGASGGMFVMDRTDPSRPQRIGAINHFRAKDPVVVKDSMAYVTLQTRFDFRASGDELIVVNIHSIANPKLVKEIQLPTPYGLTAFDTLLYVAQGTTGWAVFSIARPENPVMIRQFSLPDVKDFIKIHDRLYMLCSDRVKIYALSDPLSPVQLTEIK